MSIANRINATETLARPMTSYRRPNSPGATWFFTVNLARRRGSHLLTEKIDLLRDSIAGVKSRHPFAIDAFVVMPEHLHAIWTLPVGDRAIGMRWSLIKSQFSRGIPQSEFLRSSQVTRGERGIWQRRFWEHQIRDDADLEAHIDYIHYNPVKHGLVSRVADWPYSTFHQFVAKGWRSLEWGNLAPADLSRAGEPEDV